jgi:P-type conjugative transfer protein TrbG
MKKFILPVVIIISLTGCAHFPLVKKDRGSIEEMVPAQEIVTDSEHDDERETDERSFHHNVKSNHRHIPVKPLLIDDKEDKSDPLDVVDEAHDIALKEPSRDDLIQGMAVYDYFPHTLYKVYCAPFRATDIILAPGERLVDVTAGDTVRWYLYNTTSGEGDSERVHIIIKPLKPKLTNNIIILTNLYSYYIEAHSTKKTYQMAVSWNYPRSFFKKMKKRQKKEQEERETLIKTTHLSFNYEIIDRRGIFTRWFGKDIIWRPLRVFDDGLKTFIQFPRGLKSSEAPALFVLSSHGNTQLVNYRVLGDYYIVDRLFDEAQLIVGEDEEKPIVVEIKKKS